MRDTVLLRQNINEIRKIFGKYARIGVERITGERVLDIAKRGVEIIDREARQSTRIMVNLSGGLRPLANGLLYACYSRPEKIYRIVSDRGKKGGIIELPKLRYNLGSTKYDVLKRRATGEDESISEMAKEMKKTRGMLYQHLKELKEGGYVDEDFKITDAGRLALL